MLAPPSGKSWNAPRGHTLHPCRWEQTQANQRLRLHRLRKAGEAREAHCPCHVAAVGFAGVFQRSLAKGESGQLEGEKAEGPGESF